MKIAEMVMLNLIRHKVKRWFDLERSIAGRQGAITAVEASPCKSWPDPDKIPGGEEVPFSIKNIPIVGKSLKSCIHEGVRAIKTIDQNPVEGKRHISGSELQEIETFVKQHGIGAIGYAKLPHHLIFQERAVLYDNAIVLIMEMDQAAVLKAPSPETFKMVMSTYNTLGIITNEITQKLRSMGFAAQASHPLGGLVVYPPLAVEAGLGWFGRHGLLITPQFGPRQRISAIFVSIDNLPAAEKNTHSWIGEFCISCGKCIRSCPSNAILKEAILEKSGRKTQIEREKCLPVFVKQEGCTVCVKECTFTRMTYHDIKENYEHLSKCVQKN